MLRAAALGIALVQQEGGSTEALANADLVSTSIIDALNLLHDPKRLVAHSGHEAPTQPEA